MNKSIFLLSLCLVCMFTLSAQDVCDTLKWKVSNSIYIKSNPSHTSFQSLGRLQGAVINMDTLSAFTPGFTITNISNDTFYIGEEYALLSDCFVYTDTGIFERTFSMSIKYAFENQMNPNDTFVDFILGEFIFYDMINHFQDYGLAFEQITHWEIRNGLILTSKDGVYSNRVFYLGADTATFYVTKGHVNIQEAEQATISVYPNPAQTQFTVTNTEDASIYLYNILGQEVKQVQGTAEQTTLYTDNLPAGIYVLKVEKEGAVFTKKVQIIQ